MEDLSLPSMFPLNVSRYQRLASDSVSWQGFKGITSTEGTTEACVQKWPFSKLNFSPFIALPRYLKISERKTDERFLVDQEKSLIRP